MILPLTTLILILFGIVGAHIFLNVALSFLQRFSSRAVAPVAVDMRFLAGALDHKSSSLRGWHLELERDTRDSNGRRASRRQGSFLMIDRRLPLQLVSNDSV